jgi:hypothetical protein
MDRAKILAAADKIEQGLREIVEALRSEAEGVDKNNDAIPQPVDSRSVPGLPR